MNTLETYINMPYIEMIVTIQSLKETWAKILEFEECIELYEDDPTLSVMAMLMKHRLVSLYSDVYLLKDNYNELMSSPVFLN